MHKVTRRRFLVCTAAAAVGHEWASVLLCPRPPIHVVPLEKFREPTPATAAEHPPAETGEQVCVDEIPANRRGPTWARCPGVATRGDVWMEVRRTA